MTVCEVNDDASYIYKSTKDPDNKGVYYQVKIVKEGNYSFHLDKTPERSYPDKTQDEFRYPNATVFIGKFDGEDVSDRKSYASSRRTLYKGYNLEPGTYIVKANIDYDSKF